MIEYVETNVDEVFDHASAIYRDQMRAELARFHAENEYEIDMAFDQAYNFPMIDPRAYVEQEDDDTNSELQQHPYLTSNNSVVE